MYLDFVLATFTDQSCRIDAPFWLKHCVGKISQLRYSVTVPHCYQCAPQRGSFPIHQTSCCRLINSLCPLELCLSSVNKQRLFIYKRNSIGPRTRPCGTPVLYRVLCKNKIWSFLQSIQKVSKGSNSANVEVSLQQETILFS